MKWALRRLTVELGARAAQGAPAPDCKVGRAGGPGRAGA